MTTEMQKKYKHETGEDAWDVLFGGSDGENTVVYVEGLSPEYIKWIEERAKKAEPPAIPQQPQAGSEASPKPCLCDSCAIVCLIYAGEVTECSGYKQKGTASAVR